MLFNLRTRLASSSSKRRPRTLRHMSEAVGFPEEAAAVPLPPPFFLILGSRTVLTTSLKARWILPHSGTAGKGAPILRHSSIVLRAGHGERCRCKAGSEVFSIQARRRAARSLWSAWASGWSAMRCSPGASAEATRPAAQQEKPQKDSLSEVHFFSLSVHKLLRIVRAIRSPFTERTRVCAWRFRPVRGRRGVGGWPPTRCFRTLQGNLSALAN